MKKNNFKTMSLLISFTLVILLLPVQTAKAAMTPDGMFIYEVTNGNATITSLVNNSYSGSITLPSTISDGTNTYNVTSIREYAFDKCIGLSGTITIPDSVTSIGNYAFEKCSGLTGLNLGNSITNIGRYAFAECSGLTGALIIPDSVTSIGYGAFDSCSGLLGLNLGNSVADIGELAFRMCSGLSGTLKIPESMTSIAMYAFLGCSGLTGTLTIPDSVTSIGFGAFESCSSLSGLTIGNNVTSVGNSAFRGCSGLTGTLSIPDYVTSIGDNAFLGCSGLTGTLTIPDSVTSIGSGAFASCSGLAGLNLGNSVTSIGQRAFYGCSGLSGRLTIPDSVSRIGNSAFEGCSGLTRLSIGNSVTSIGDWAFYSCSGLAELTIGNSVTSIGRYAFSKCWNLAVALTIPDSVTSIGDFAFYDCYGLTGTLAIPDNVTSIGERAFSSCKGLTGLTIGSSVTSIGDYAFAYCTKITTILAKPIDAPKASSSSFSYINRMSELYTPNTPANNISYEILPWSYFVRAAVPVTVISGANRFDTAALISKRLTNSAYTVILTTGRDFPDALSAGPLAVQLSAPILLSEVDKIPTETLAEIKRLGASKVIIMGGVGAIDSSVEASLENLDIIVERISGSNRFHTAIETAKKIRASSNSSSSIAILVNGYGFADALSIGGYAAKWQRPILLTSPNSISPETKKAIIDFGINQIEIVGGELAISKAVEGELVSMGITVTRISGSSRFATSAAIAEEFFFNPQKAIISNGRGFADALAAVPVAVQQDAPILLVEQFSLPSQISSYLSGSTIKNVIIAGGELAVSSAVRNEILHVMNK